MGMLARLASDPDRLAPIWVGTPPAGLGMEKTVVWSISPAKPGVERRTPAKLTPRKSALGAMLARIAPVPSVLERLAAKFGPPPGLGAEKIVWWSNWAPLRFALLKLTPARFTPLKSTLTKGMLDRFAPVPRGWLQSFGRNRDHGRRTR